MVVLGGAKCQLSGAIRPPRGGDGGFTYRIATKRLPTASPPCPRRDAGADTCYLGPVAGDRGHLPDPGQAADVHRRGHHLPDRGQPTLTGGAYRVGARLPGAARPASPCRIAARRLPTRRRRSGAHGLRGPSASTCRIAAGYGSRSLQRLVQVLA